MKKILLLALLALLLVAVGTGAAQAAKPAPCTTIQGGLLKYSATHYLAGTPLTTGYDPFGYNYQAHMFSGGYFNAYAGGAGFPPYLGDDAAYLLANPTAANHWAWPYRLDRVAMKWNDAWLSNRDCNGDGKLDRYFGFPSYIGSGAWETNHMSGEYQLDGKTCRWSDFVKIVAVPADAVLDDDTFLPGYPSPGYDGVWYAADDTEIGPGIWGAFALVQEVYNDPCGGYHGVLYKGAYPGFGGW